MGEVAAIGSADLVAGFGLAGARVCAVDDAESARAAWQELPPTVAVVILTAAAATALREHRTAPRAPLSVVMP